MYKTIYIVKKTDDLVKNICDQLKCHIYQNTWQHYKSVRDVMATTQQPWENITQRKRQISHALTYLYSLYYAKMRRLYGPTVVAVGTLQTRKSGN